MRGRRGSCRLKGGEGKTSSVSVARDTGVLFSIIHEYARFTMLLIPSPTIQNTWVVYTFREHFTHNLLEDHQETETCRYSSSLTASYTLKRD